MKQKILRFGWLIIAVIMLAFVPKEVRAQEEVTEVIGDFTVTKYGDVDCSFDGYILTVKDGTAKVSTSARTSNRIALVGTVKLILAGVDIRMDAAPIDVTNGSNAEIELAEGTKNTLESTSYKFAGIHVDVKSKVTFTGSGELDVKNTGSYDGKSSCGIGGQKISTPNSCGTIIFDLDGKITAQGGDRAAGIGTCMKQSGTTPVYGCILIKKGIINATGGYCASGIGTGPDGGGGSVKIYIEGGTITANGNYGSGGIGNGYNGNTVMQIAITGGQIYGNVKATGQAPYYLDQVIIGPDATVTGGVSEYKNGIVFSGNPKTATIKGDVIIPSNVTLTIDDGETLTIPDGRTLTIEEGGTLINNGTIIEKGTIINNGTQTNNGTIKYERTNLTVGKYGTICLPYAVAEKSGAEFFSIAGKKIENGKVTWLILKEVEGDLNAGQPYIFKATADKLSCTYSMNNAATSPGNENGLIGSFTQIAVPADCYALKENVIYKCSAEKTWNIAANRAYINMGEVSEYNPDAPSSANHVVNMRVSGGTTGIDAVRTEQQDGVYYNMQGQRVASPSHGIYIVNGKKVIIK